MNRKFLPILTLALATAASRLVASGTNNAALPAFAPAASAPVNPPSAAARPVIAARGDTNSAPVVVDATPAPARADGKIDFQSFHLITDRNIFDMSRTGITIKNRPVHQVQVDEFTLDGIMSYEKGQYAFFDGSSFEYQQTRKLLDTIAGYKIAVIGSDYVQLVTSNSSKVIKMPVGTTIRREDKGPWSAPTVRSDAVFADTGSSSRDGENRSGREERGSRSDRSGRGDRSSRSSRGQRGASTDAGTTSASDQPTDASSGGSAEDVIKRLMEKRAKEVKDDQ